MAKESLKMHDPNIHIALSRAAGKHLILKAYNNEMADILGLMSNRSALSQSTKEHKDN